jgi:Fic family protein
MRMPPKPPKFGSDEIEQAFPLMGLPHVREFVAQANREYYHWEKLRHRPPKDLTPEQAWNVVRFSRLGSQRSVPLVDIAGRVFHYWLPDYAVQVLHVVDRTGGNILTVEDGTDFGSMRDRLIVSSLMEEAIATSQIEGAVTTRTVAKEMLRTNRKPRNRSEQMIVNSYRTIQMLRSRLDDDLSLDLLLEIQESMTRDTLDDDGASGRFRTPNEKISVVDERDGEIMFEPPPAEDLGERVGRLLKFANTPPDSTPFIHPLVRAAILHFWLAYEHPFVDGNGRTARALFYWFMLKSGYWLFEFLTISRIIVEAPAKYYRSFLYSETDNNDLTYSIMFQLGATQRALLLLREHLAAKQAEQKRMAAALRRFPGLNHRQRALLDHAVRKGSSQIYTFQSHLNSHGISYLTARHDLTDLVYRGLLREVGGSKQRSFLAAEKLSEMLSASNQSKTGRQSDKASAKPRSRRKPPRKEDR